MTLDLIIVVVLALVIGGLLGTLLAVTKMYNKQIMELTKALIAKNLTDYSVNTTVKVEEPEQEDPDVIAAEEMTDAEFDRQIKEQLNG